MNQINLAPFANFNTAVPWGLWVAVYTWLVGISAGAFCLIMWGNIKNVEYLKKLTRLGVILSVSTLSVGLLCIFIDLGRMERFYNLMISPNFASSMAWMFWLYGLYFMILALTIFYLKKGVPGSVLRFSLLYGLLVLLAESLLFAIPPGKEWHSVIFPLHFISSSLASGAAALIFMTGLSWAKGDKAGLLGSLGKAASLLIGANLIVELIDAVSFGGLIHAGKIISILGNGIVLLLLLNRNTIVKTAAGFTQLAVVLFSKYIGLISAQLIEPFKGFERAYIEPRLEFSYMPSAFESITSVFLICSAAFLFYFMYKILPLTREE